MLGLLLSRDLGIGDLWRAEPGVTSGEMRTQEEIGRKLSVVADACNPALRRLRQGESLNSRPAWTKGHVPERKEGWLNGSEILEVTVPLLMRTMQAAFTARVRDS